ncbi:MAG: elongation factor G [Alphaproteobacteria bacterium]
MGETTGRGPRVAALVGPYLSGKTTLLESLLFIGGAIPRKGTIPEGNTVGDSSPEGRARQMSVELNVAETTYLGDSWTFLDCPGSFEFLQESYNALMVADVAVVVVDPDPARAVMVTPLLKFLDERNIPHMVFINRVDQPGTDIRATLEALQAVSDRPLVLRELPIREGDEITGFVDLVSERAYRYHPGQPSDLIKLPESLREQEKTARQEMLEHIADFDDHLLEQLLEDVAPPREEIYQDLAKELAADLIVPVFFGSAGKDEGVHRLLKALRHDTPAASVAAARLGVAPEAPTCGHVFKTVHAAHLGKLSLARVWTGEFTDGMTCNGSRASGLFHLMGGQQTKAMKVEAGGVVAIGRLDEVATGDMVSPAGGSRTEGWPKPLAPLASFALEALKKGDEVKLTAALTRLGEEDASLTWELAADTHQLLLWGQGDVHLQVAVERLRSKYNVEAKAHRPLVPYKETIRKGTSHHSRFKRQSGGHGQFADVVIDIAPQPRGTGFVFAETIVGGVVPRQYIPSVETGVREFMVRGPLGFPVVDVGVTLTAGSYHAVDSSDQAFKTAAQMAMREAMPSCEPVLLEPIISVELSIPSESTSKAQRALSTRRGQILGFDRKPGWEGWDVVNAFMPQSEMHDLIVELRSITMGVGTFAWAFDHLQELVGKHADAIVKARAEEE